MELSTFKRSVTVDCMEYRDVSLYNDHRQKVRVGRLIKELKLMSV